MKKIHTFLGICLAIAFLAGCSPAVQVQQDNSVNISNYRTYSWVETHANENDNTARAMAYADISVRNAANAELQQRGWTEVTENPDVIISYDVLVERSREQRSDPVYSQPFTRMYYNPYMRRWGSIYFPQRFLGYQSYSVPVRQGTITISLTDAKTDRVIWQGWTTENMNYSRFTESQINKAIHNILKKLGTGTR